MNAILVKYVDRCPSWLLAPLRLIATLMAPGGSKGRLAILIYHRVHDKSSEYEPESFSVQTLDWQMRIVSRLFNLLSLQDAIERLALGTLPPRALAITFDDGYRDNLTLAAPILIKHGVPATFFITCGGISEGRLWNDRLVDSILRSQHLQLRLQDLELPDFPIRTKAEKTAAISALLERLKVEPPRQQRLLLNQIIDRLEVSLDQRLILSEPEIRQLQSLGMTIGCHTMTHPMLSKVSPEFARQDILSSKVELERICGKPVTLFAYPYGKPDIHFEAIHEQIVAELGFAAAVSTAWGANSATTARYRLKRFTPWDANPLTFFVRLLLNYRKRSTKD
ncbi:MAG: peptidoglycan/xylan/chitin deacetylase (PgdA/CDA1 family) [Motiliproteus sp.]|jgi:peptidoglycan/xylan/chitin deacetylase (PgdA/CDA1 family)